MLPDTTGQLRIVLKPILVPVYDLDGGSDHRRHGCDTLDVLQNRLSVIGGEGLVRSATHVHAAGVHAASKDHDDIRSEGLNLLLHLFAGALADRDRADDCADADDDSEHRQNRS